MKQSIRKTIKRLGLVVAILLGLTLLGISPDAKADLLFINNPGFEDFALGVESFSTHIGIGVGSQIITGDPIPGWVLVGHGGTYRPDQSRFPGGVPEGNNTAWLEYESIHSSTLSQVLSDVLTADTVYTLSVDLGRRLDYPLAAYSVQLLAGGALLSEGTVEDIPAGEFRTVTVTFTASPDHPQLGQALEIRFVANADRQQANFDNVRLDATPL
jgi:hypothetical protein